MNIRTDPKETKLPVKHYIAFISYFSPGVQHNHTTIDVEWPPPKNYDELKTLLDRIKEHFKNVFNTNVEATITGWQAYHEEE